MNRMRTRNEQNGVGEMNGEELQNTIAESIRAVAEQVITNADEYARNMDYATGLRIVMDFEINSVPRIRVEKDVNAVQAIIDNRCRIWTRTTERE